MQSTYLSSYISWNSAEEIAFTFPHLLIYLYQCKTTKTIFLFYGLQFITISIYFVAYGVIKFTSEIFFRLTGTFFLHAPSFLEYSFTSWHRKFSQAHLAFPCTSTEIIQYLNEFIFPFYLFLKLYLETILKL